ncbi:MAG: aminopeptidase [Actinomycetota bacterium]|jgi:aminopeptidase N|nr:aminopeptidase [Actinomycetota bacterium]
MEIPSLTQDEASRRAALLEVERYDVAVDLTDLTDGDELRVTSTVSFRCNEPGASTFIDAAVDVRTAVLNGTPIDAAAGPRIELRDLRADNVLVITSVQTDTGSRTGVHRSVDPSDKQVYVWTSFEPDEARRAWACFDQPDLKAVWRFDVTAPADWTVLASTAPEQVTSVDGGRRWVFADTPPLSSYVPALNAGPFHEIRREIGGYDLGLYCRTSLAANLDRDADELFELTGQGLAFFGEQFGMPFPQRRYDQVFVPDMGGAMENYGCVVWGDTFVFRTPPTDADRESRAAVLLHEMAHMWFGDIVTMRWWDDLWLNEAFAEWACHWAAAKATQFTDIWAAFLAGWKLGGYASDRAPSRHPIRQDAPDVATAAARFDNITYAKGASVLKQLVAYVGEDAFVAALRTYFGKHAWGNATLEDLMGEIAAASGRDMSAWTRAWLETSGADVLSLDGTTLRAEGPDGPGGAAPRPHRLDVGVYRSTGSGYVLERTVPVELTGTSAELPAVDPGALLVVNDDDLTFADVRPGAAALEQLLTAAPDLPSALARTVAVTTGWHRLVTGELPAARFVDCATRVLEHESVDTVVEPVLGLAVKAADLWSRDDERDELLAQVADRCLQLAQEPTRRPAAVRALAQTATTDAQLAALAEHVQGDVDLQWRRLIRLAALGQVDLVEAERLEAQDPDPDAWVRALTVRTATPDPAAKSAAWDAVLAGTTVPLGSSYDVAQAFWQRSQADVLAPFGPRFVDALKEMGAGGMIPAMVASAVLFPRVGVDEGFLSRLISAVEAPGINPIVAHTVIERGDELRRMLAARQ